MLIKVAPASDLPTRTTRREGISPLYYTFKLKSMMQIFLVSFSEIKCFGDAVRLVTLSDEAILVDKSEIESSHTSDQKHSSKRQSTLHPPLTPIDLGQTSHITPTPRKKSQKCFSSRLAVASAQSIEARCSAENEDVVGAGPTGAAPTTSAWSTILLPTKVRPTHVRCWTVTFLSCVMYGEQKIQNHRNCCK